MDVRVYLSVYLFLISVEVIWSEKGNSVFITRQTAELCPVHRFTAASLQLPFSLSSHFLPAPPFYSFITEIESSSSEQQQQLTKK